VDYAAARGIAVIEDAALAVGARVGARHVGTFGVMACLSFHPRKTLTTGEGGMILTGSSAIAASVSALRSYGASVAAWDRHRGDVFALPRYESVGYNFKLTDLQASIGLVQTRKLPEILAARRAIARRYDEELGDIAILRTPREPEGRTHGYQSYVCRCDAGDGGVEGGEALRAGLHEHLRARGIASVPAAQSMASIAYYQRRYGWSSDRFPRASRADRCCLALPIYPGLTSVQQGEVIKAVREWASGPRAR